MTIGRLERLTGVSYIANHIPSFTVYPFIHGRRTLTGTAPFAKQLLEQFVSAGRQRYISYARRVEGPALFVSEVDMGDPRWTPAWKRLRVQCYERDKAKHAVCVHCGQPIDYEAKPSTTDDSYEPDHRVPIETHPEYALLPENVQPSHKKCNRARGSRAGINNLGKRTRNWGKGS